MSMNLHTERSSPLIVNSLTIDAIPRQHRTAARKRRRGLDDRSYDHDLEFNENQQNVAAFVRRKSKSTEKLTNRKLILALVFFWY